MIALGSFAAPIDQANAFRKAQSFLNQHELNLTIKSSHALTTNRQSPAAQAPYYIFNSTDGNGFVIVAGDDCAESVLGYSDTGIIDPDNMPDGLADMLGRYQEEMTLLEQLDPADIPSTGVHRVMSQARVPVEPLIKNFWGHMSPYSKFNPKVNDTTCVVGCATVALSELMGFHKYPENSIAVSGYTTPTRQCVLDDLPVVAFDWANMRNVYKKVSYSSTEGSAVGWLMRYVGQSLKSDYNATATSANSQLIPSVLRKYGYHSSDYWDSKWMSLNEWEDLLYEQVSKGLPVMMVGSSTNKSGHVFLCDGYDKDDYFHIDWGWEGSCKGYFKLSLLSPYKNLTDNYNYTNQLAFVYDIYPLSQETPDPETETDENKTDNDQTDENKTDNDQTDENKTDGDETGGDETGGDETGGDETGGDETGGDQTGGDETGGDETGGDETGGDQTGGDETGGDETGGDETGGDETGGDETEVVEVGTLAPNDSIRLYTCLSLTNLTVSGSEVTVRRKNETPDRKLFEHGLGLYDKTYKMVKLLASDTLTYASHKNVTTSWSVSVGDMKDGTYRIYPVSRLAKGDGIWHFDYCKSTNSYINVTIADGSPTFKAVKAIEYNSFEFIDTMPLHSGAVRRMKVNLTNNMMEKYNQNLYLLDNGELRQVRLEQINKNTTGDVEFVYYPKSIGLHTLTITADTTSTKPLFTKEIEALESVKYKLKFTYSIENYNKETKKVIGNKLRMKVTVTNNGDEDYNDYIRLLRRYVYWDQTAKYYANIPKGKSQEFYFENEMAYGAEYNLVGYYKTASTSNNNTFSGVGFSIYATAQRGITYYTADETPHFLATSKDEFVTPEEAVALDLTSLSTVPSNIVPNSNPNTLYYVTKNYSSLAEYNQIVNLEAERIVLADEYSCFVPRDFTAADISYTRTFEKGFMGMRNQNNWSTIVLPFDVQTITDLTDEKVIDWFKPGQKADKNFWLRRFYGEEGYYAYFTNAETFKAGMPYIITVPGNYKGEEYSLVGKQLKFSATDATVKSGKTVADAQHFNFEGSYSENATKGSYVYQLDEEANGNNFVYVGVSSTVHPFRAYFTSATEPIEGSALYVASYIDVFEEPSAIVSPSYGISSADDSVMNVYSISGTKVSTLRGVSVSEALRTLPSGIYIINGKKYLK